jgi:hypothetical protein
MRSGDGKEVSAMRSFIDSSGRRVASVVVLGLIVGAAPAGIAFAGAHPATSANELDAISDGNSGASVSRDRLVIVYEGRPAPNDTIRRNARAAAGGELIRANRGVSVDVVRVPDAAAAAQRIRDLPGVRDAYPDAIASIRLTVNDQLLNKEWGVRRFRHP